MDYCRRHRILQKSYITVSRLRYLEYFVDHGHSEVVPESLLNSLFEEDMVGFREATGVGEKDGGTSLRVL